jgi:hypothetical protein
MQRPQGTRADPGKRTEGRRAEIGDRIIFQIEQYGRKRRKPRAQDREVLPAAFDAGHLAAAIDKVASVVADTWRPIRGPGGRRSANRAAKCSSRRLLCRR